ncbi:MAG: hypothetical protein WC322_07000 [Candidatus Paceibacterota bacterium]|jgi:hypothetical protein
MMYFSKSTNGFYDSALHGRNIPNDAVEISNAEWRDLLQGQSDGRQISADSDGRPVLRDREPRRLSKKEDVEQKIRNKMNELLRAQAIQELKAQGEIKQNYTEKTGER